MPLTKVHLAHESIVRNLDNFASEHVKYQIVESAMKVLDSITEEVLPKSLTEFLLGLPINLKSEDLPFRRAKKNNILLKAC